MRAAAIFLASAALLLVGLELFAGQESPAPGPRAPGTPPAQRLPGTVRITRAPDLATIKPTAPRHYTLECIAHFDQRHNGSTAQRHQGKVTVITELPLPIVTLLEGERVSVTDTSDERFVIAEHVDAGIVTPVARETNLGTEFEATVLGLENDEVALDVSLRLSGRCNAPSKDHGAVHLSSFAGRILQRAMLGKKVTAQFDGWSLELVVRVAEPPSASSAN